MLLTVISPRYLSRISMNRDMCVPLKWWGRSTNMLTVATVGWVLLARSSTTMG